jgi:type II secretory pathway pseudopilin PulG
LVALKNALTTPPAAAITVLGNVAGGGVLKAYNTSTSGGGVTIHAGGNIGTANFDLYSVPGSNGSDSVFPLDTTISDLAADPPRFFASVLGAWPDTYRLQPAAIRFECPNSGCRQALADKIAANPGRVIWIPGDLTLDTAGDVGSLPDPAVLTEAGPAVIVATGRVRFLAAARIYGLVYTQSGNWEGSGEILGAAVVQDNLAAAAAPTVVMTPAVLDALRLEQGSFVLLPGGWKDFAWVAASIRPRGIALIEALVALAIMALGMVAIMGVQVTLRSNGDLSRQRAEAVRIAQESLEDWRGYLGIESDADPLTRDYPDLATDGPTTIAGLNASYARTRTVVTSGSPPMKQMSVVVAWTDRTGEIQSVQLSSAVAAVPPDLVGSLALPSNGAPGPGPGRKLLRPDRTQPACRLRAGPARTAPCSVVAPRSRPAGRTPK